MQKKAELHKPEDGPRKGFAGRAPLAELDADATKVMSQAELRQCAAETATQGTLRPADVKDVLSALPKEEK